MVACYSIVDDKLFPSGLEITVGQWTMSGQNRALSKQICG